ncbi:uncharacterized protein DSM5745_00473 [Aspergillus mulundensis]|uniref:Uncharacterized protein n=1 Tax=Aspergillus mulundensis TaxID=1810919 RepID=A0A3D8T3W5_9EURO|nr:Uncharacterized protein DSM5745_00473 [Aspergillus mulundensis]RDW93151.1 Uncharacterized protein DSM5745_00473 [Aspergillus mulundensis]
MAVSLFATLAEAKYPFSSEGPKATLRNENTVSFDPLGVAAVLHNPRAAASAAKLYVQFDNDTFHWPHMSMVGGTLPAIQMLVEYVTSGLPSKSLEAPIKMCAKYISMIPVRSDFVFRELPLDFSNGWLGGLISFRGGELNPGNDFMVVYIGDEEVAGGDGMAKARRKRLAADPGLGWWMAARLTLYILILINGAMILAAMLIGILAADIWAFTLFFLYGSHWIASALITFLPMVHVSTPPIDQETSPRYAAYERPEGGTVIFKGPKKNMEAWARTTWKYEPSALQSFLHWCFMITGALAAFSSVACMVNMHGYLQLAFLAVLVYATVAEIIATKISRWLQTKAKGGVPHALLTDREKRTESIIDATIAIQPACRLEGFDWLGMGLLPNMPAFRAMQPALAEINAFQRKVEKDGHGPLESGDLRTQMEIYYAGYRKRASEMAEEGKESEEAKLAARRATDGLAGRLVEQMRSAGDEWIASMTSESKNIPKGE